MKIRRKNYFINPALQTRCILMSMLPALLISIYSIFFLIGIGKLLFIKSKNSLSFNMPSYIQDLKEITQYASDEGISKIVKLEEDLFSLQIEVNKQYLDNLKEWENTKIAILHGEIFVLLCIGILALFYSHRIAGPIYRIKKYIEILSEGKEIPHVKLRNYDEFKDLAESLNKLKDSLKNKK